MGQNVTEKLIQSHLVSGEMIPGEEIGLKIDQTLCQDATGTMVMLELDAMGIRQLHTEVSAQYIDHNLLQNDFKNADDHGFLLSACRKFGIWFSRPGNGVSHPVHMERFGIPGKTLVGSDSHTCAAGSMGMLAIGVGGLEVALGMAGEPLYIKMPRILGIELTGKLSPWVSAKDIILEVLRRYDVDGGIGRIIEYYGPGLQHLTAMDRHVIANMGAELGATTSVFPSDTATLQFLDSQNRKRDWKELVADPHAQYDEHATIDLATLEPLIACPSSPGNVVPVSQVAGKPIYQAMVGSSANPGLRDFVIPAMMVQRRRIKEGVSFDINPTSSQVYENLTRHQHLEALIRAGARIHQPGCNGCIGMGQAPASGKISLRTVPRNFPGRSGTKEDQVYLCSPEVATASALTGVITDPRTLGISYPEYKEPSHLHVNEESLVYHPGDPHVRLEMGPNIQPMPKFGPMKQRICGPVMIKVQDNISTDEILPAGSAVLPFRSNIPEIARFTFAQIDDTFHDRAIRYRESGCMIVAGANYGQGSSREHAAIAPRYLGVEVVIAKSFARIHRQNLINFGIIPLLFDDEGDHKKIDQGDILELSHVQQDLVRGKGVTVHNKTKNITFMTRDTLSPREREELYAGGLINLILAKKKEENLLK